MEYLSRVCSVTIGEIRNWTSGFSIIYSRRKLFETNVLWKVGKKTASKSSIWLFSWSIFCLHRSHWKRSPWKGGCREAILEEVKRLRHFQMTQELDFTSVVTGLMQWWILPRTSASTLLKQCVIILTEQKAASIQKKRALECLSRSLGNYS